MFNAIFFFLLCRFIFIVIHLFHFVNLFHRRKPLRGKHVEANENLDHVVNKKIEEFVVTASRFLKVQNIVPGNGNETLHSSVNFVNSRSVSEFDYVI